MTDHARKLSVALLSDEDIPASFQLMSKSFGHDAPFIDIYFPAHDTPAGQEKGSKRLAAWKQSSPDSTFLKAVHPDQNDQQRIIGFAVWTYMQEPPPAELHKVEDVNEVWPDEQDREFMTRIWKAYVTPRSKAIEESRGGVYVLELLAVHPEYQRKGAGAALVKWGTQLADDKGLESIVEGTPASRRLYEKCGMHTEIEEMQFEVGEEFSAKRVPTLIFLRKKPAEA